MELRDAVEKIFGNPYLGFDFLVDLREVEEAIRSGARLMHVDIAKVREYCRMKPDTCRRYEAFTGFSVFNVSNEVPRNEYRLGDEYYVVYADSINDAIAAIYNLAKNCRHKPPYIASIALFIKETMDTIDSVIERHWRPPETEGKEI